MMGSLILDVIRNNPDWKSYLQSLNVNIKIDDDNLAIFNYGVDADFTNPIVREARGIIIDLDKCQVICRGFDKFNNPHEPGAKIDLDNFNWNNFRVEDKLDGSIIKAYYKPYRGVMADDLGIHGWWAWATNACINAFEAPLSGQSKYRNFGELIESAMNFGDIPFNDLNPDFTYIFELISPDNQVVIKYPYTKLIHIGTRNNITGEEYRINIGIEQPDVYEVGNSLDDCMAAANRLNQNSANVNKEGFVVVDDQWHRVKVKSPEYLVAHKLWNNGNISKENALKWLMDYDSHQIDPNMTGLMATIKYYDYQMAELTYQIDQYITYVRALYEEYSHDRKAVALKIKNDRYAAFGFQAIGNEKTANKLLLDTSLKTIGNFIPDYIKEDIFVR